MSEQQQWQSDEGSQQQSGQQGAQQQSGQQGAQWQSTSEGSQKAKWGNARPEHKSVIGASMMSLMPGMGQIYCGFYSRGFVNITVVATIIMLLSSGSIHGMEPFFGLFLAFFWIYNMVDAGRCAQISNMVADGATPEDLLKKMDLPQYGSGKGKGIVFIVLGVVFLMRTKFDFDLSFIGEWWPLFFIIVGVKMLMDGKKR